MKQLFLAFTFIMISTVGYSQENFKWDVITDSLKANKSQLYSGTKLFIAETWKSAQDVIQSDDKESGVILIKAQSLQTLPSMPVRWIFNYTIKFMVKDNKCRIVVERIHCSSAKAGHYEWPRMPVLDTYPESGLWNTGLSKKRYLKLMYSLKNELQSIVDNYVSHLQKPAIIDEW